VALLSAGGALVALGLLADRLEFFEAWGTRLGLRKVSAAIDAVRESAAEEDPATAEVVRDTLTRVESVLADLPVRRELTPRDVLVRHYAAQRRAATGTWSLDMLMTDKNGPVTLSLWGRSKQSEIEHVDVVRGIVVDRTGAEWTSKEFDVVSSDMEPLAEFARIVFPTDFADAVDPGGVVIARVEGRARSSNEWRFLAERTATRELPGDR
jgi:hypothetical protein